MAAASHFSFCGRERQKNTGWPSASPSGRGLDCSSPGESSETFFQPCSNLRQNCFTSPSPDDISLFSAERGGKPPLIRKVYNLTYENSLHSRMSDLHDR